MKMNKLFVAALAAVTLVSCNKDDLSTGGNQSEGSKVVALSVANQTITKSMTEAIESDHEVGFEGGYIVFTDAGDRITNVFQLVNDVTHPDIAKPGSNAAADTLDTDNGLVILIDDIEDNYFFRVNSDAAQVHVFGNTDKHSLAFTPNAKGQIDTYLANYLVAAAALADADGAVENVPLYGVGPIQNYPDLSGTDKGNYSGEVERVATVEIKPVASRLELAKMTAINYVDGSDTYAITNYELEGVFLNYFHTGMAYSGKQTSSNGFVAFNSLDDFEENASSGSTAPWYSYANRKIFYDFDELAGIADYTHPSTIPNYTPVPATATATWAYNMFQASTTGTKEPEEALPHLILKMKNVTVTKNGTADPDFDPTAYYYITIRRYMEKGTSNKLAAFEGGVVYHIEDLQFDASNLKDVPEWREPIVAEVMFKVMKWQSKPVDTILD